MNVIYLDQNFAITFAENSESDPRYHDAREAVLDAVASGKALFPYSDLHLIEFAVESLAACAFGGKQSTPVEGSLCDRDRGYRDCRVKIRANIHLVLLQLAYALISWGFFG